MPRASLSFASRRTSAVSGGCKALAAPPLRPLRHSSRGTAHTPSRRMTQSKHRLEAPPRSLATRPVPSPGVCLTRPARQIIFSPASLRSFPYMLPVRGILPRADSRRPSQPLSFLSPASKETHHDHARSVQPLARAGPLFYCPARGVSRWPIHSAPSNSKSSSSPACCYFSLPHFLRSSFLQSLARASLDCFTSAAAPA